MKYDVRGRFTIEESIFEIEADSEEEAMEIFKKKRGRTIEDYVKVEFKVIESGSRRGRFFYIEN